MESNMSAYTLVTLWMTAHAVLCESSESILIMANSNAINEFPVVGILAQEQSWFLKEVYKEENFTSYIAASYVKAIESAGARVVPIMIGKNYSYYEDLLRSINGVLFPGGSTYFNVSDGYADAGQHMYEIAQRINDEGVYFPIFGVCLGFELLIILASGRGTEENRIVCFSHENLRLNFTPDYSCSKMFRNVPDDIIHILEDENVTANAHNFCVVDKNLEEYGLNKDWLPTSYSESNGIKFIATIENKRYPFYGVQFHPEKPSFEWKIEKRFPHSQNAIVANRHFYDFFVSECRKNKQSFNNEDEARRHLIYNYIPYYTGAVKSGFEQCYMFEPRNSTLK